MIAILGGSGLGDLTGMESVEERRIDTPWGAPSDALRLGVLAGVRVAFLARHGRHHHLLPGEINYRANFWALKSLGVEQVISVSAVGSLRERIAPRHVVAVDQFIDRTRGTANTFFGEGIVAHVALADPICERMRQHLVAALGATGGEVHDRGTYVCIEGPAFSTRAESEWYRTWGADVIGMTNAREARLAREAELCYATMALVTDFDCWHKEEQEVSVASVIANLQANAVFAAAAVRDLVLRLSGDRRSCPCGRALDDAILTSLEHVPQPTLKRLALILARRRG